MNLLLPFALLPALLRMRRLQRALIWNRHLYSLTALLFGCGIFAYIAHSYVFPLYCAQLCVSVRLRRVCVGIFRPSLDALPRLYFGPAFVSTLFRCGGEYTALSRGPVATDKPERCAAFGGRARMVLLCTDRTDSLRNEMLWRMEGGIRAHISKCGFTAGTRASHALAVQAAAGTAVS